MTTVRDILERKGRKVAVISPEDTVFEASRRMAAERIGSLVVQTESHGVVGMFTERDILRRVVAEGRPPTSTLVGEVMSSPVACCKLDTPLKECQSVMTERRLRHLPVVENQELLGIISIGDIMAQEIQVQQSTIEYLHAYLHGRI